MQQPTNQTTHEQRMWEHYQQIENENILLHQQISKMRKENKHLKHVIRVWKGKCTELSAKAFKTPSRKDKRGSKYSYK